MRIIGIDPGYERLGVAIIERQNGQEIVLFSTCLETSKKSDFSDRLVSLGQELEKIITDWQPNKMAIEKLFFTTNQKTAIAVAETRGVITFLGRKAGLIIEEYTPLQVKMAISGYGKADKKQVIEMVKRTVKVPLQPKHDDEYDAIAVAVTALAHHRFSNN